MTQSYRYYYFALFLLALSFSLRFVDGVSPVNRNILASASIPRYHYGIVKSKQQLASPSRRRILPRRRNGVNQEYSWGDRLEKTIPAARTKKQTKPKSESSTSLQEAIENPKSTQEIYNQLGPIGKIVAGTVEVAVATLMEYCTGFFGGYVLGSITDVPRFMFKNVDEGQKLPFFQELSKRYGRMHAKSYRWAKTWAGVSATFGCSRVATKVLRGGKEDEWNTIFSSAAAGAYFARAGEKN